MKLTIDNIKDLDIKEYDKQILKALLLDIMDLNNIASHVNQEYKELFIDYQDFHNEYSAERTEPCPDYYGFYTLRFAKNPNEKCGIEMDLETLDIAICTLYNYIEFMKDFKLE